MASALFIGFEPSALLSGREHALGDLVLETALGADAALLRVARRHDGSHTIDAVVIGPSETHAVAVAQRVYSLDRDVGVLILAPKERLGALRSSLAFAPFVGRQTKCEGVELQDEICRELMRSVAETRARRAHRRTLHALSSKLASTAVPKVRATSVLDRLLELAPVGIVALNSQGAIDVANQAAQKILGSALPERGADFAKTFYLGHAQVKSLLRRASTTGLPESEQLETEHSGGRQTLEATVVALDKDSLLVIFQDITERVRATREREQLLQKLEDAVRMRDEFLSVASHELRTPLASMMGWLGLIRTGRLAPEKHAQALETIERNARAQAQLIEDLLDVSRIVSGKVRLELTSVALDDITRQAIESVSPAAEAKGIRVQVLIDTNLGSVMGDANRLQQVIWNLLTNAVKFTPKEGTIWVTLRQSGSSAEIVVRDTGIGIPQDFLPMIFDRFRQADMGTTRTHGGLGLGLSIVRQFVELHGGTVLAQSQGKDQGATFTVRLPLPALTLRRWAPPGSKNEQQEFRCPPRLAGARVLVVEDEPSVRELLVTILTGCDLKVVGVGSAEEGLEELQSTIPDVIVSDIGMPGIDGYEFIRRVRALPPEKGGKVPAVAITAYARGDDRGKALAAGFQMHVAKPIPPDELLLVLATLTDRM